jgi:hypothetical protein
MRLTIDIPPELESRLSRTARHHGVDVAEYVRRLIEAHVPSGNGDEATLRLLAQWDAEDSTDDPAELQARQREWEEFKGSLNSSHSSNRRIYP